MSYKKREHVAFYNAPKYYRSLDTYSIFSVTLCITSGWPSGLRRWVTKSSIHTLPGTSLLFIVEE